MVNTSCVPGRGWGTFLWPNILFILLSSLGVSISQRCPRPLPGWLPSTCVCFFLTLLKQRLEEGSSEHGTGSSFGQGPALSSIALTHYMGPGTRVGGAFVQGIPLTSLERSRNPPKREARWHVPEPSLLPQSPPCHPHTAVKMNY